MAVRQVPFGTARGERPREVSARTALERLERLPAEAQGTSSRLLWIAALLALGTGLVLWAVGGTYPSVAALWCFVACAALVAIVLPLPYALVSPLYMGVLGWLVDMLPLVILAGWTAVVLRWVARLWMERRWPRGGRFVWLPVALFAWTCVGVVAVGRADFKHFLLLTGIQFVVSGALLAVIDSLSELEDKARTACALAAFVTLLSAGVFLQWTGVPVESLQDPTARQAVEEAYGLDSFPNSVGMIKYARSVNAGALQLREQMDRFAAGRTELPSYVVFRPTLQAFENSLVVRFDGSARTFANELESVGVTLLYDNVGLAPANTVPRLRSFPRNALTYAGVCAALFPIMLWLAWGFEGRRRLLGRLGAVSCLFGAGLSLARGSWLAILIGVVYLVIDGMLTARRKQQVVGLYVAGALVLTGFFLVKYGVDPATGRAGGGASVNTRSDLYGDTVDALRGKYLLTGYGTEVPRLTTGGTRAGEGQRYVPRAGTHSTYLNYLFRTGIPGAAMIATVYALAILHARAASRTWAGNAMLFATLAAAAVVSAAAHAVILSLYVEPTYTLTVTLVLGLALAGTSKLGVSILPWRSRSPRNA